MTKLKRAFQMLASEVPQRKICMELHMGRGVLNKYKSAADNLHISYAEAGAKSTAELEKLFKPAGAKARKTVQHEQLAPLLPDLVKELHRNRYMTVQMLHERYRQEHPDGYGYTQFKNAIRDYQKSHNLSFHNTYYPGEEMQIDFAGDNLWLTDAKTGEKTRLVVLVCVLPYSGLAYAEAMADASLDNFFAGISNALTAFGGAPKYAKSDNMKQWVKRYDRYEPTFNDSALEWGAYYDIILENCRVRTPRDKGPVEGAVFKVYHAAYAVLQNEEYHDLNSMNSRIMELMDEFNSKPSKVSGVSRFEVFEKEEKVMLHPLPDVPFRLRHRKTVRLGSDYHIIIDKHKYSVPHIYVGQKVTVMWDVDNVEIYVGNNRVATHMRSFSPGYTTCEEHMPDKHLAYKRERMNYNAEWFIDWAARCGVYTQESVENMLNRYKHPEQSYQSCWGIVALSKNYGRERLEKACKRMHGYKSVTYTIIKNILEKGLDKADDETPATAIPVNTDIRGAEAFDI
ncbi:MAG: IS21 family transposase [Bacteroidales bacterium]|jgi:transposase|nr:IS21 family transposase [Bacteroidales bacterium]